MKYTSIFLTSRVVTGGASTHSMIIRALKVFVDSTVIYEPM